MPAIPNLWTRALRSVGGLLLSTTLTLPAPTPGQQRDKAVELHAMAGAYFFGSNPNLLKNDHWAPQVTLGTLIRRSSKWGIMVDATFSDLRLSEGLHHPETEHPTSLFYKANPGVPNEDRSRQKMLALFPSAVGLLRRDRFTVYFGGGMGIEHHRQTIRYREARALDEIDIESVEFRSLVESGSVLVGNDYVRYNAFSTLKDTVTNTALFVHGGILASLSDRITLRAGYCWILTYLDALPSQSLGAGIGYRF